MRKYPLYFYGENVDGMKTQERDYACDSFFEWVLYWFWTVNGFFYGGVFSVECGSLSVHISDYLYSFFELCDSNRGFRERYLSIAKEGGGLVFNYARGA